MLYCVGCISEYVSMNNPEAEPQGYSLEELPKIPETYLKYLENTDTLRNKSGTWKPYL